MLRPLSHHSLPWSQHEVKVRLSGASYSAVYSVEMNEFSEKLAWSSLGASGLTSCESTRIGAMSVKLKSTAGWMTVFPSQNRVTIGDCCNNLISNLFPKHLPFFS